MLKKIILLFSILFSSSATFASGDWFDKGNGGFLLQCGDKNKAFDLYETEERLQLKLDKEHLEDLNARVLYLISKIRRLDPERANQYQTWYTTFFAETEFKSGVVFNPIGDIGFGYIPVNCTLQQVIFQRAPSILNKSRYTINEDLWKTLGILDQAAMVLHELIYREFSAPPSSHSTSESTRVLNAWIHSTTFNDSKQQEYLKSLQDLHMVRATVSGIPILLAARNPTTSTWENLPLTWDTSGLIETATVDAAAPFHFGDYVLNSVCESTEKLGTRGRLQVGKNVTYLNPLVPSAALENCLSELAPENSDYLVRADKWILNQNSTLVGGSVFGRNQNGQLIAMYKQYVFRTFPLFPITFSFEVKNKILNSVSFNGRACFLEAYHTIKIWKDSIDAPNNTWKMENFNRHVENLPACTSLK